MMGSARRGSALAGAGVVLLWVAFASGCLRGTRPETPALSACVVPVGGWAPGEEYPDMPLGLGLSGVVMEAGDGDAPDGCFDGWAVAGAPPGAGDRGAAWWFRAMGSDGRPWTVGVHLPGVARSVDTTTEIAGDWYYEWGGFSPDIASLALYDASTALLAWIGEGGALGELDLPPLDVLLEQGGAVYRDSDECGTWEGYDLEVIGDDGGVTPLPYGGSADLGAITFWHGGFDRTTETSDRCSDWFVADVLVAAAPL